MKDLTLNPFVTADAEAEHTTYKWLYPLILALLVVLVFLIIECKHPFFFLQDDNRDYYLPYFIYNYNSLTNGELALYNFHQFLGTPVLSVGQSAVLYPIAYLSVFLSQLIFGNGFAAIDIYVILHLLIGAIGFYSFLRLILAQPLISLFGGLTWSLSSFIVYSSNSWVVVAPVAAYFPWMLFFNMRLYKNPSLRDLYSTVAIRLLLFYTGHIQYFIYSSIFEVLTMTLYVATDYKQEDKKPQVINFLKHYFIGYLYVFILSLTLLLPMWHQTSISAQRTGPIPFEVFVSQYYPLDQLLLGLFFPFTTVSETTLWSFRNMSALSHIGYATLIILIAGFILRIYKKIHLIKHFVVYSTAAIIAFLWATNWLFNIIIYIIPFLNRFRWPFKLALFFDFYLIVMACLILVEIVKKFSWRQLYKSSVLFFIIGLQIVNFLYLYVLTPYRDFGEHHGDPLPLEEKLIEVLTGGRIISIGFDTWNPTTHNDHAYNTAPTLGFNYATLWGLDYFAGYEPLISSANAEATLGLNFSAILDSNVRIPVDYFRELGVRWYLVPTNRSTEYFDILSNNDIVKIYEDAERTLFYDDSAYPMVFRSLGGKIQAIESYKTSSNTIELDCINNQTDAITLNYLFNPFFEALVDGEKTLITTANKNHMDITVPPGKHHIQIKYKDPYFMAGTITAAIFLSLVFISRIIFHLFKDRSTID